MISIDFAWRDTYKPDLLESENVEDKIKKAIADAPDHEISGSYNDEKVREALKLLYGTKCAYCETDWLGGQTVRVDHYRPKKKISGIDPDKHWGYYWLSYEWTNLLPTCDGCNNKKRNHFPLLDPQTRVVAFGQKPEVTDEEHRMLNGVVLRGESRSLLHPELDEVEKHLEFDRNGEVIAKEGSQMAKDSIKYYGLNRQGLILARRRKVDRTFQEIVRIFNAFEDGGGNEHAAIFLERDLHYFFMRLLEQQEEDQPYSRLGFYMFHHFEQFYVEPMEQLGLDDYTEFLLTAYNKIHNALQRTQ